MQEDSPRRIVSATSLQRTLGRQLPASSASAVGGILISAHQASTADDGTGDWGLGRVSARVSAAVEAGPSPGAVDHHEGGCTDEADDRISRLLSLCRRVNTVSGALKAASRAGGAVPHEGPVFSPGASAVEATLGGVLVNLVEDYMSTCQPPEPPKACSSHSVEQGKWLLSANASSSSSGVEDGKAGMASPGAPVGDFAVSERRPEASPPTRPPPPLPGHCVTLPQHPSSSQRPGLHRAIVEDYVGLRAGLDTELGFQGARYPAPSKSGLRGGLNMELVSATTKHDEYQGTPGESGVTTTQSCVTVAHSFKAAGTTAESGGARLKLDAGSCHSDVPGREDDVVYHSAPRDGEDELDQPAVRPTWSSPGPTWSAPGPTWSAPTGGMSDLGHTHEDEVHQPAARPAWSAPSACRAEGGALNASRPIEADGMDGPDGADPPGGACSWVLVQHDEVVGAGGGSRSDTDALSSGPATDGDGSGSCTQSPPPPLAPWAGGAWARIRQGLAIRRLDSQEQLLPPPGSAAALLVKPSDLAPRPRLRDATRCAGCGAGLSRGLLGSGAARLCHYRRLFYCTACHANEPHVIPARLLLAWDLRPRPVCREALADLELLFHAPIIAVPRDLAPKALARSLCGLPLCPPSILPRFCLASCFSRASPWCLPGFTPCFFLPHFSILDPWPLHCFYLVSPLSIPCTSLVSPLPLALVLHTDRLTMASCCLITDPCPSHSRLRA